MSSSLDFPLSVEEAGALLGATITRCGKESFPLRAPPKGMHSSFATTLPVPSSEISTRLYDLRALLRSSPTDTPLTAAPSLLAVLMKLVGVSTALAAASTSTASPTDSHCLETPPLWSTPLRKLWVDCVVLCHVRGEGLTGTAKIDTTQFVRKMLALASTNPRSARAAGGVRIAALDVVTGLLQDETSQRLASQLAPWSLDVLQVCLRALRSAGNGEPTYRVSALRMSCATAMACRRASLKTRPVQGKQALVLQGAMEDKAIVEAVKVLRLAVTDKFPEVRRQAANLAAILAPLLLQVGGGPDVTITSVDDVLQLCLRNLDDESPYVSDGWADALARCLCTAIEFQEQNRAASSGVDRDLEGDQGKDGNRARSGSGDFDATSRFGGRKSVGLAQSMSNVKKAVSYLVDQFVRVGGELVASRAGGTFSAGGRAVRVGFTLALTKFVRLQYELGSIGEGRAMSLKEILHEILEMAGPETEKQLRPPPNAESAGPMNPLFGAGRSWSKSDSVLVRVSVSRVLRRGLCDVAAEPVQVMILQDLIEMLGAGQPSAEGDKPGSESLNAYQLQVALVEISHLVATLGEAASTKVEELVLNLKTCLAHSDLGVCHEAAIACASLTAAFPSEGRKLLWSSMEEMQRHHEQLLTLASTPGSVVNTEQAGGRRMFRRNKEKAVDPTIPHQNAIHGIALMVSIVIKDLPRLCGALPCDLLNTALSAAEILVACRHNEILCEASPASVCFCVRAGFSIISGILATGPDAAAPHVKLIFDAWQQACKAAKNGGKTIAPRHDLFCIDSVLASIVVFLKHDSELLLSIDFALSQVTALLEDVLGFFAPEGRFDSIALTPPVASRLESAKAALLEAFAWLPSGSFPTVADQVFGFAASHIRQAVENDVTCSILQSLVNKEDSLLDAKTLARARRDGQVGGAADLEETILSLTAEVALHRDREAILMLQRDETVETLCEDMKTFRESHILGYSTIEKAEKPPTPLHEVGTWRMPVDPSCASKVRLVDASIEAFAATFGLKSGKEQQQAMIMLESLVPPLLAQLARTLGMTTALTEQERRSKAKEDFPAVANITAVLLSCLQALPLHEATHNVPIGLGPPWMNKAKELLLTLLPSTSTIVRRAAAEGLALLATVGVTEDAHFLQSTVLHSLDEVMQGNKPDGKPRALGLEPVSAARAGSPLTLAYIQRTAHNVAQRQLARARARAPKQTGSQIDDDLPILQMMTRILPSVACHGFRDYFVVRTYALHSFGVLVSYSRRLDSDPLSADALQLLRKGVELVEENFGVCWTASSNDVDRGQEAEKMTSEASFLAVLLRLMTIFCPHIWHLASENPGIERRFCGMASLILESYGTHPAVFTEAMAFFEVLASRKEQLPTQFSHVLYSENPAYSCIPAILASLVPDRPSTLADVSTAPSSLASVRGLRAAALVAKILSARGVPVVEWTNMQIVSHLAASLETACGSRRYHYSDITRSLAVSRGVEEIFDEQSALENEISSALTALLVCERSFDPTEDVFLRWILFARSILSGSSVVEIEEDGEHYSRASVLRAASVRAAADAEPIQKARWQTKTVAARLALVSLEFLRRMSMERETDVTESTCFNFLLAEKELSMLLKSASDAGGQLPESKLVFHLEEILGCACMSSVATLDQAELYFLQEVSIHFLAKLVECFGKVPDPEDPNSSILDQYSTQIFSATKHAIQSLDESDSPAARRLFIAGCEVLNAIVKTNLTSDPMVLKRLLRPIVPANVSVFRCEERQGAKLLPVEEKTFSDTRTLLLPSLGKLLTAGNILMRNSGEGSVLSVVARELILDEVALAVHSASAAIDGASLLYHANLSLAGHQRSDTKELQKAETVCGYLFQNDGDIDESVKTFLVTNWASFASCAVRPLVECASSSDSNDKELVEICSSWIRTIVPLLLAGIRDACDAISASKPAQSGIKWAEAMDPTRILVDSIRGVTQLVVISNKESPDPDIRQDLDEMIELLYSTVLRPVIKDKAVPTGMEQTDSLPKAEVVAEVCFLLQGIASSKSSAFNKDSALLVSLLTPLDSLQKGHVSLKDELVQDVVAGSLIGIASLIAQGAATDALVETMIQFVLATLSVEKDVPVSVENAARGVLRTSLSSDRVAMKRRQQVAKDLVLADKWEAWIDISPIQDGAVISESLDLVQQKLSDTSQPTSQLAALVAIRTLLQKSEIPGTLAGVLFHGVGSEILVMLYQYGSLSSPDSSHRTAACADAIKILLLAHQQLSSSTPELTNFLQLFFATLLAVLRWNGLPNHPTTSGGDAALGRMCAQAILHVARATPEPFKSSVAALSTHDSALLEFAVRGEMTGYATAQAAPTKKKISLKGFTAQ